MNEKINRTLRLLPDRPGVYIMKNSGGQIIYVGKAKNLANRVRSYFHSPGGLNAKTRALVESVEDISYIVADSELEALLLENNLLKRISPITISCLRTIRAIRICGSIPRMRIRRLPWHGVSCMTERFISARFSGRGLPAILRRQ